MSITITTVTGDQFAQWIEPVADLRITVLVLAMAAGQVAGASTALPMLDADQAFQAPFIEAGWDLERVYYFGESVLLPAYRPHDVFWSKRGYQCRPDLECQFPWRDLGDEQETHKTLRFWVKE